MTALVLKTPTGSITTTDKVLVDLHKSFTICDTLSDEELDSGILTSKWHLDWYKRCFELFGVEKITIGEHDGYQAYDILEVV